MTIIPDDIHRFLPNSEETRNITKLIDSYIIHDRTTGALIPSDVYDRISIIKTEKITTSRDILDFGVIYDDDHYNRLIQSHNLKDIETDGRYTEVEVIRFIYNAKYIIFSWGEAFQTNFVFISDRCRIIYVLVPYNKVFIDEYRRSGQLFLSHNSANIVFILLNLFYPIQNVYLSLL